MGEKQLCPICRHELNDKPVPKEHFDYVIVDCAYCGEFKLTGFRILQQYYHGKSLVLKERASDMDLCIAIRQETMRIQDLVVLDENNVEEIKRRAFIPRNPFERIDIILKHVAETVNIELSAYTLNDKDLPRLSIRTMNELRQLLKLAFERDYLEITFDRDNECTFRVLSKGWDRIEDLIRTVSNSDEVFIAMKFGKSDIIEALNEAIIPALKYCNYKPILADKPPTLGKICDKILSDIRRCAFVVADFTYQNQGVYFEAGFALALGKPVVWCCKKKDVSKLHFDTRQYNHILWNDAEDLKEQLIDRIGATIGKR